MARSWTTDQKKAIESKSRRLLVCAAAGSGKTAVLTERIIKYVTDKSNPGSISRLLIVTFTRAAAAELRSRIREALEEALATEPTEHLAREVLAVSGARISTIHSFCYDLIREEGAALGISRTVRLIDEHEDAMLMRSAMEETIKERYVESDDFSSLVESLVGYRNDADLARVLIKLYESLTTLPQGIEFLNECATRELEAADKDFFLSVAGEAVAKEIIFNLNTFKSRYLLSLDFFPKDHVSRTIVEDDLKKLTDLINGLGKSYSMAREAYKDACKFEKFKPGKSGTYEDEKTAFKDLRASYKDYTESLDALFAQTDEETRQSLSEHHKLIAELYATQRAFEARLNAAKRRMDVCSFSDLEQLALKLLYNEDGTYSKIATSVSSCFDRVFIDEYQDVNNNQRMIFDAIASQTGCFRVGDIKQNIYAFRGSDPSIIDSLRVKYDEDGSDETENIFMSKNFRSSKTVLDYINEVCEPVFRGGRFRYDDSDKLNVGREDKDFTKEQSVTVLCCINGSRKDGTVAVREEVAVADEIERLVREECLEDGRRIKYGDIAILLRKYGTHSGAFISELERRGIPVAPTGKRSLFNEAHVSLLLSALQAADNPLKDIPLCAVLFSPIFRLTVDELTLIQRGRCGSLWQNLTECAAKRGGSFAVAHERISLWRELARKQTCDSFLHWLLAFDGISDALMSLAETDVDRRNTKDDIDLIYDMSRSFGIGGNRSLSAFVEELEGCAERDKTVESAPNAGDGVSIMSVHASKGLEFPVCFVAKANSAKSTGDSGDRLQFNAYAGVGLFLTDPRGFVLVNTPTREALRLINDSLDVGEEDRILYVALTRARERLYVTAGKLPRDSEYKAECRLLYGNTKLPGADHKIIDLALHAAKRKPSLAKCISIMPTPECEEEPTVTEEKTEEVVHDETVAEEYAALIEKRIAFEYADEYLTRIPAKISVSDLSPSVLDEAMPAQSETDASLAAVGKWRGAEFNEMPDFLLKDKKASAAEAGTATHQFLQFCDIANARDNGIEAEADRLCELGFITEKQKNCLRTDELSVFVNGDFARRLESADSLRREFRFNCFMPAHKLTENNELAERLNGKELPVQGVIDGFFLEGEKVYLFDYKTDRIPEKLGKDEAKALLSERYRWQLSCYAEALKRIFSRKISGAMIYSTALGEAFSVDADMLEA
ncbi:MAG: UvrD-helicase domain-containing protein [Clostridia bacterium]|nr:UvrD-helicase domain-containing protein [Clostridia bacterium]